MTTPTTGSPDQGRHSPLPWRFVGHTHGADVLSVLGGCIGADIDLADAAFIVRAVNSHADLLNAAQFALGFLRGLECERHCDDMDASNARLLLQDAIDKAEGQS